MLKKYFRIWKQLSNCAISSYLSSRLDAVSYFTGKVIRFSFFLVLIISIFHFTSSLAGYSKYEVIFFFLTFNLMDVLAQAFFRGIYMFQGDIRRGNFDYLISKPVNPLFYCLTRLTDILDILFLIPIVILLFYVGSQLALVSFLNILAYLFFVFLGLVIILALHIFSACVTIWTAQSEGIIWLYRDLMALGRFPPEIFSPLIQILFTFVLPIIVIVAFPVKALLGILPWYWAIFAFVYALGFFTLSLWFWQISLKKYASASS